VVNELNSGLNQINIIVYIHFTDCPCVNFLCVIHSFWCSLDCASLMYSFKYTNKMQRYTISLIAVNALRVSGGFSAHHQVL